MVPSDVPEDQVPFESGDIFRVQKLSQLQRRLFALNQFSVVTATPILTGSTDVPVRYIGRTEEERPRRWWQCR